jgi:HAD superfamily hydrolase (TIGR01509 family)
MKKFSAVIFDLDGVIVDSEPLHQKAFEDLFAELGRKHDHGIVFSEHVGLSDHSTLRAFLKKTGLQHELEDLNKRKMTYFLRYLREHRPIFKELHSLIPELAKHYHLGVATSSPHQVAEVVMEISGLKSHFQVIIAREDIRFPKPDPEIYFTAARKIGVRPSTCCVIEDSTPGIQAAKMAGMTVIGLTTTHPSEKLKQADLIAHTYDDVRKLLL